MLDESFLVRVAGIDILVRFVSLAWGKRVGRAGDLQGGRGVGEFSVTKRQEVDEVGIDDRLNIVVGGIISVFIILLIQQCCL